MTAGHATSTDQQMRGRGLLLVAEAARKIGVAPQTIYRWISDGKVVGMREGYRRFVLWQSVLKHLGRDAVRARGYTPDDVWAETRAD